MEEKLGNTGLLTGSVLIRLPPWCADFLCSPQRTVTRLNVGPTHTALYCIKDFSHVYQSRATSRRAMSSKDETNSQLAIDNKQLMIVEILREIDLFIGV